jgi:hypothetical protein
MAYKVAVLFKNIWNAALGIVAELFMVAVFIAAGLAICVAWWSLFIK